MTRPRLRFGTLRRKIVVSTLALIAVGYAVVGLITAAALHLFLVHRLESELRVAGDRFATALEHPDQNQRSAAGGLPEGTMGARLLKGRVTAAAVIDDARAVPLDAGEQRAVADLQPSDTDAEVRLGDRGDYRVLVSRGTDGDLLVTGLPEHPVDETIARLVLIEAVVFGIALVVVGFADAALIRLALRPLDRVAATARTVAGLPLASGAVRLKQRAPSPAEGDREVAQVATAVNHMIEQVDAALRQREASEGRLRRFLADASHELRTPVAVVRSHAEYARRAGGELPDEVTRSLQRIDAEAGRMGRLVEDLLTLARLDSGRPLADESVDLTRIVLDSVSDARVAGPDHRWRLVLPEEPVLVRGDDHALRQVLSNLLANARIHTPPDTVVTTTLTESGTVTVADNGPGLSPEIAERVFERFVHRGDNRNDATPSTASSGLGLSIVSAIVEALHGTIEVSSVPGRTEFRFSVPLEV